MAEHKDKYNTLADKIAKVRTAIRHFNLLPELQNLDRSSKINGMKVERIDNRIYVEGILACKLEGTEHYVIEDPELMSKLIGV